MLNIESRVNTTLNPKILFIIFLTVVSFVVIDVVIGSLVDVYHFTTSAGISLFVAVSCVLFVGTYIILKAAENKIRGQNIRTYENRIVKAVWAVYYIMIAIMAFVTLQLLFSSEYYTALLSIAPTISYGFAVFVLSLLAYRFLLWFIRNRALILLTYGIASISASMYVGLTAVIFNEQIFIRQPAVTTLESAGNFPELQLGLEELLIVRLPQILAASTFLTFWVGTMSILYGNIRRIGKKSFWIWILATIPIIFFVITLIFDFPVFQGVLPEDEIDSFIYSFYITTFSQVSAIALFAAAFAIMGRTIRHHQVSDYMYITCYGLALFSIGMISTVSGAGYPPFGLPSVLLVGPFSFLLFIGLNHSAIATAEDSKLRQSIKTSAREQLRLLDSIGTAEWERKLEKKILEVTKSTADNLKQQSGIEPSISMDETKQYIFEVLQEIKNPSK